MEIERKYLIDTLPEDYQDYPCRHIEQAYLNTDPVIRIRKDNNKHELTYKSKGLWQEKNIICHLMKLHISICSQRLTDVSSEKNVI